MSSCGRIVSLVPAILIVFNGMIFGPVSEVSAQGRVLQNVRDRVGCCERCQQDPCCCQQGIRLVNPNQFFDIPQDCPPQYYPPGTVPGAMPGAPSVTPQPGVAPGVNETIGDQPSTQPGNQPVVQPVPGSGSGLGMAADSSLSNESMALTAGLGVGQEASFSDVATIGDFFGGGAFVSGPSWGGQQIILPVAGGDRRYKLSENTSPIPMDRVFFTYNVFDDAVVDSNGNPIDLNRYLFGAEKTFNDGKFSLTVRVPIANGADSQQIQDGRTLYQANEFGNLSLTAKRLLYKDDCYAVSTGLGLIFPTAAGSQLVTGTTTVDIANTAYHLQPFIAIQRTPNKRRWATLFTQFDFAAAGNAVTSSAPNQPAITQIYNDQHLWFIDLSFGQWLYRNNCSNANLRGLAGIFELHYTTTLNDTDSVLAGNSTFGNAGAPSSDTLSNPFNRLDVLNATMGLRFQLGEKTLLTVAGVAPLRAAEEGLFDGEFVLQLSRRR